jgi:hypothetical protein
MFKLVGKKIMAIDHLREGLVVFIVDNGDMLFYKLPEFEYVPLGEPGRLEEIKKNAIDICKGRNGTNSGK